MLAIFVQTVVNNKYLGHFVMVLYIVATIALPPAGFQDYLFRFGQTPPVTYSDMNGYGPFLQPLIWFRLYWGDCGGAASNRHQPALGARDGERLAGAKKTRCAKGFRARLARARQFASR